MSPFLRITDARINVIKIYPVWIVAFVGHRPSSDIGRSQAELAACRPRVEETLTRIDAKARRAGGHIELLTSVAAGSDIETAEVAKNLRIPIHIILPTSIESFRHDFEGDLETYWPRAQQLIDTASSPSETGSFRFANASKTSPECYHDTNIQIIRSADVAIAIWNKRPASGMGGTQEFIEEAARMKIPTAIINPIQNSNVEYKGNWSHWPPVDPVIDKLNKDVLSDASNPADSLFSKLDKSADRFRNRFRERLLGAICLFFLAGLLAAIIASYSSTLAKHSNSFWHSLPITLTAGGLVLVLAAVLLLLQSFFLRDRQKWRRARFAAELLRSYEASSDYLDPLIPIVTRHKPHWHRFAISISSATAKKIEGAIDLEQQKETYLKHRIRSRRDHYFATTHRSAHKRTWLLWKLGFSLAIAAPVLIFFATLLNVVFPVWANSVPIAPVFAEFLPILSPLIAGVATTFLLATDLRSRAGRYQNLGERLDRIAEAIPGVKTRASFNALVLETEEILLDEFVES